MAYGIVYVFGCVFTQNAVHFPLFFLPPLVMVPLHSKLLLDACFRQEEVLLSFLLYKLHKKRHFVWDTFPNVGNERRITVITRALVIQRNIFADQIYELLRFFFGGFTDLKIISFFCPPAGNKTAGNVTGSDENKGHANPLTRTVRHRSIHSLIKTKVSVSGSVAVFVSMRMESCTIYFYLLDFYRCGVRIRIFTKRSAPLDVVQDHSGDPYVPGEQNSIQLSASACLEPPIHYQGQL